MMGFTSELALLKNFAPNGSYTYIKKIYGGIGDTKKMPKDVLASIQVHVHVVINTMFCDNGAKIRLNSDAENVIYYNRRKAHYKCVLIIIYNHMLPNHMQPKAAT